MDVAALAFLSLCGVAVAGYHPAAEDGGIYLAAIQHDLNPSLFPWDSDFLTVKLQASFFDRLMAGTVQLTHIPLDVLLFGLHLATVFAFLAACYGLASLCFAQRHARWAAVSLVTAFFTLPITGTGLYLMDQNLVPRAISVTLALFAARAVMQRRWLMAALLLLAALPFQPVLAALGISLCVFLAVPMKRMRWPVLAVSVLPMELLRPGATPAALHTAIVMHHYCDLAHWTWYEWLGILGPIALLLLFGRSTVNAAGAANPQQRGMLARRAAIFAIFQTLVAMAVMLPPSLERLRPFEPMRYLYFVYVLLILLVGGMLGERLLHRHAWRWAGFFLPVALGMFLAQRTLYPASPHLEVPGLRVSNPWVEAFSWARQGTPRDAYFVVGAEYQNRPGEDHQVFRAVAQRSVLADVVKDSGMVLTSSRLAERWQREVTAQNPVNWQHPSPAQLRQLRAQFGVTWAVLEHPDAAGLTCPYRNELVAVCRID